MLGGEGWTLRKFYTEGGLASHLIHADRVEIITLEGFVAKANRALLWSLPQHARTVPRPCATYFGSPTIGSAKSRPMTWLTWLMFALIVAALAAITGLKPRGHAARREHAAHGRGSDRLGDRDRGSRVFCLSRLHGPVKTSAYRRRFSRSARCASWPSRSIWR